MARALGEEASHHLFDLAVITMPAYFNHGQIEATRQAGELAGFEVAELLHEPTAAAIFYSWLENHGDATYLVYDLGGGTFDLSILRPRGGTPGARGVSAAPSPGAAASAPPRPSFLPQGAPGKPPPTAAAPGEPFEPLPLFEPSDSTGPFARLVRQAETLKM